MKEALNYIGDIKILYLLIGGLIGYLLKKREIIYQTRRENRVLEARKFLLCYQKCLSYRTRYSELLMGGMTEERLYQIIVASDEAVSELLTQSIILRLFFNEEERVVIDDIAIKTKVALNDYGGFILAFGKGAPITKEDRTHQETFNITLPNKINQFVKFIEKEV